MAVNMSADMPYLIEVVALLCNQRLSYVFMSFPVSTSSKPAHGFWPLWLLWWHASSQLSKTLQLQYFISCRHFIHLFPITNKLWVPPSWPHPPHPQMWCLVILEVLTFISIVPKVFTVFPRVIHKLSRLWNRKIRILVVMAIIYMVAKVTVPVWHAVRGWRPNGSVTNVGSEWEGPVWVREGLGSFLPKLCEVWLGVHAFGKGTCTFCLGNCGWPLT